MRNELQGRGARLIRAIDEIPEPVPEGPRPEAEPRPRERTTCDTRPVRIRIDADALVRLDACIPRDCPQEIAEGLVRRHRIPGRVYSGLLLADPVALRRAWAATKEAAHGSL